jgi:mannose/fructose/N-acetylgalactosamine-specific phosphotransferase system component IIC
MEVTMFSDALLIFLFTFLCVIGQYHMPNIMADRPIFIGPVIGLILGDFQTGCIIGAQMELVFLGVVFVGSATSADAASATAIAVAFSILNGLSVQQAIAIAVPLGYICAVFTAMEPMLGEVFTPIIHKQLKADNQRMFTFVGMGLSFIELSIRPMVTFIAVMFGGDAVSHLMKLMPEFVLTGVNVAGTMLPVVGLTVLASLLWNKKTSIFFLFGFFLMKYLELEILFLAIIAIFIAMLDVYRFLENRKPVTATAAQQQLAATAAQQQQQDEEEFFK